MERNRMSVKEWLFQFEWLSIASNGEKIREKKTPDRIGLFNKEKRRKKNYDDEKKKIKLWSFKCLKRWNFNKILIYLHAIKQ